MNILRPISLFFLLLFSISLKVIGQSSDEIKYECELVELLIYYPNTEQKQVSRIGKDAWVLYDKILKGYKIYFTTIEGSTGKLYLTYQGKTKEGVIKMMDNYSRSCFVYDSLYLPQNFDPRIHIAYEKLNSRNQGEIITIHKFAPKD